MIAVLGRRSLFAVLTALAMALMVAVVAASAAKAQAEKIDICHAVPVADPNVNHYNLISVDNNATFGGHAGHRRT